MSLLDILACPVCRTGLVREQESLSCASCRRKFPVSGGVPVLLPCDDGKPVTHEDVLDTRDGFEISVQQVLDSMPPHLPILDIGAGNRKSADPRLVRMDVFPTPYVDVVGDAHALPFKDESFGFVHSCAVFEHLARPWIAAKEIERVLMPGGYVFADCSFVFPFHGYPSLYFNASADGMRQLFCDFHEFDVLVLPWQTPSYGIRAILGEYLRHAHPTNEAENEWLIRLKAMNEFPFEAFEARMPPAALERVAAGTTFIGQKRKDPAGSIVPPPLMTAWENDPALKARYPDPEAPVARVTRDGVDSLLRWGCSEGRLRPEIAAWYDGLRRFVKGD